MKPILAFAVMMAAYLVVDRFWDLLTGMVAVLLFSGLLPFAVILFFVLGGVPSYPRIKKR